MKAVTPIAILLYCLLFISFRAPAQEESDQVYINGTRYLNIKIHSLEKYNSRIKRQQEHLIKQLKRKEKKLAKKLKHSDSASYAQFHEQRLSYDSIGKIMHRDSVTISTTAAKRHNRTIDSLRMVQSFIQNKSTQLGANNISKQGYATKLTKLQNELTYRKYIDELISQRTNNIKAITGGLNNSQLLSGIEKSIFYSKQKMNVFKQIEEDPSKGEEKALEYLQGTDGFDKAMNDFGPGSMQSLAGSSASASDLEKMGFQTKKQIQDHLLQVSGNNMTNLTQGMTGQVKEWQDKFNDIQMHANTAKQTKASIRSLRHIDKPSFKINPMRGLPFWKRVEKQYNFQTTRASLDGIPATLQLAAMAGFRHTPTLTYGIGIASSIGLGQNWNNIRFSLQGIGIRTYAEWKWQYGIGAYAEYERIYKQASFIDNNESIVFNELPHTTKYYSESILIGVSKRYHINNKWNGAVQLLYDVWWQQKELRTPLVLRFSTIAK